MTVRGPQHPNEYDETIAANVDEALKAGSNASAVDDDTELTSKVTAAIEAAIQAAVDNGTIDTPEDAVVIMQPDGHIIVLPADEAGTVVDITDDEGDSEDLPPFELPAMYQNTSGDSLADSDHYQDHLTAHWGF